MKPLPQILPYLPLKKNGKGFDHLEIDNLNFFYSDIANKWLFKWHYHNKSGDLIEYLRRFEGKSFHEAKSIIEGQKIYKPEYKPELQNSIPKEKQWQTKDWQKKANRFVYSAHAKLMNMQNEKPMKYLIEKRGLNLSTIDRAKIGYFPKSKSKNGFIYPEKHTIPVYNSDRKLIRVRLRYCEKQDDIQYSCMSGSDGISPYPIGIKKDEFNQTIAICESELDGLLINQESGFDVGVLALGHAKPPQKNIVQWLNRKSAKVILAFDNDTAGKEATEQWKRGLPRAHVLKYSGKDIGTYPDKVNGLFQQFQKSEISMEL